MVSIDSKPASFSAEKPVEVSCKSSGSRPPASISWFKGNKALKKVRDKVSIDGNTTVSVLTLIPTADDQGKQLICRSENTLIQNSVIEDGFKLEINCKYNFIFVLFSETFPFEFGIKFSLPCIIHDDLRSSKFQFDWPFDLLYFSFSGFFSVWPPFVIQTSIMTHRVSDSWMNQHIFPFVLFSRKICPTLSDKLCDKPYGHFQRQGICCLSSLSWHAFPVVSLSAVTVGQSPSNKRTFYSVILSPGQTDTHFHSIHCHCFMHETCTLMSERNTL